MDTFWSHSLQPSMAMPGHDPQPYGSVLTSCVESLAIRAPFDVFYPDWWAASNCSAAPRPIPYLHSIVSSSEAATVWAPGEEDVVTTQSWYKLLPPVCRVPDLDAGCLHVVLTPLQLRYGVVNGRKPGQPAAIRAPVHVKFVRVGQA